MTWREELDKPHHLSPRHLLAGAIICIVLVLGLLYAVVDAHAQPAPKMDEPSSVALKAALGSYLTFSVIDAKQTRSCLVAGTCTERNPMLKPFAGSPSRLVAVKLAANSGVAYGIWKLHKRKPKTALVLGIAAAGFQGWVVAQNARVKR